MILYVYVFYDKESFQILISITYSFSRMTFGEKLEILLFTKTKLRKNSALFVFSVIIHFKEKHPLAEIFRICRIW